METIQIGKMTLNKKYVSDTTLEDLMKDVKISPEYEKELQEELEEARERFRLIVKCIKNDGYPSSLTVGKFYKSIPDKYVDENGMIRIIDDTHPDRASPDGYIFSRSYFEIEPDED